MQQEPGVQAFEAKLRETLEDARNAEIVVR